MLRRSLFRFAVTSGAPQNPFQGFKQPKDERTDEEKMRAMEATTQLPVDFITMCFERLGVRYQAPVLFGLRKNEMRAVYLAEGHDMRGNEPIMTIPLESAITGDSLLTESRARADLTLDRVRSAIKDPEMRMLAPQIQLGFQCAHIASTLPERERGNSREQLEEVQKELCEGMTPWVRMIQDENFDEEYAMNTYARPSLDDFQSKSYKELTDKFNAEVTRMHEDLQMRPSVLDLRRFTRVIMSRMDVQPLVSNYNGSSTARWMRRKWWKATRQQPPFQVCVPPFADMLNHSNVPNVSSRIDPECKALNGKPAIVVFSLRPIRGGEELCRHYNFAMSRDAALFRYGFLPFQMTVVPEGLHSADGFLAYHKAKHIGDEAAESTPEDVDAKLEAQRLEKVFRQGRGDSS